MTSDTAQTEHLHATPPGGVPVIYITRPSYQLDWATILGLILSVVMIVGTILLGRSNASFLNLPSFVLVVLGTMTATSIAFTARDLKHVPGILGNALFRPVRAPGQLALQLLDIATVARKKGLLTLTTHEAEFQKDKELGRAIQLVTDGFSAEDVQNILSQDIDSLIERHRRSASILRRAAEIAPAMGLLGTLIGLVQMLSALDNPSAIGPAMALALLTTFYGAIIGTVILAPLAAKLERNSNDEARIRTLIMMGAISIARQENPRRLEILLNSELPPEDRIRYFN